MSKVSYTVTVNNTASYYKLIGLCILLFILLSALFMAGIIVDWIKGEWPTWIAVAVTVGSPIAFFYWRRKDATEEVTILLDETSVEIYWPKKTMVIPFTEVKSYSADRVEGDESDTVESVRIRLKNGRKVRLYATDSVCNIKSMGRFRADFGTLAHKLGLKEKYFSW